MPKCAHFVSRVRVGGSIQIPVEVRDGYNILDGETVAVRIEVIERE